MHHNAAIHVDQVEGRALCKQPFTPNSPFKKADASTSGDISVAQGNGPDSARAQSGI